MFSGTTVIDTLEEQITLMAKQTIYAEGEMHQQPIVSLCNLRTKRNSFLPVFRLPPELLATVFVHGARDHYESDNGGHFTPYIPAWVNVSYVCRHWRNIALNSPALWAYHFNTSLRWTEELLLRSKQASLKICIYPHHEHEELYSWQDLLDNLLKHSERIQELQLDIPAFLHPDKLFLCASRLEKLEINLEGEESICTITGGDKLPLHTLKLSNCSLPWYSLNLSGLKTLSLSNVYSPSPLNMVEFLAVLGSMQYITTLHVNHVLTDAHGFLPSGGLDTSQNINLPCLVDLAIGAPLSTVIVLLSCVNIPRMRLLQLGPLYEAGSSVSDYAPISSFIAQRFSQQSSGLIFRSLAIDAWVPSLTFGLYHDFLSPNAEMCSNIPLRILPEDLSFIHDIHCSLSLTNIQSLHISAINFLSPNIYRDILGYVDALQYMKLSDGYIPELSLRCLAVPESNENLGRQHIPDQDPTSGHTFVPALEELELESIMFAAEHTSLQGVVSQRSLIDTLSTRKGLQDRLTVIECGVTDDSELSELIDPVMDD